MTIRTRLLLLVLAVLMPAAVTSLWLIGQTFSAERQAHERTLRDTTRALALVVERELDQRIAMARVLSGSSHLDTAPELDPDRLRQFARLASRAMQGMQGWVELRTTAELMQSTAARAPGSAGGVRRVATEALSDVPLVLPLLDRGDGDGPYAAVVQPVQRGGKTRLNLALTILPSELQSIIDQQLVPADWVATVLDNHGNVVARHPGGTAYAGRPATADLKQRLTAGTEGGFDSMTLDGAAVTGYFSTSRQGWTYLTAMPSAQFTGRVPAAALKAGVAAALLLGLTVLAALWVARRIAEPVQSLKRDAADMQAGLPVHARATGIVECDEVSSALAAASDELRRGRLELERRVAEAVARTRVAEQRASHSQRVEALGRLTGGVAHDFNNLLGVISNSAHLLERQLGAYPELQVPVAATLRAVQVGGRLTQHLLRVAGRQPVRPQAVDPARYLPDVRELLQTVLGKRVEVSVTVAPDVRPIRVDVGELELALINLALNARDAIAGSGRVWVQARNAEPGDAPGLMPGEYVLITVTDDGGGVDEEVAGRVFEPFFTTKAVGKGTGLGLSQVHGFCVQAGGTARLESTPGLGTTVSLLLPVAGPDADLSLPPAEEGLPLPSVAGLRVLLVEDNEALADTTAALLDALHCQVQRASSADEALRLLGGGGAVDVVLSDVVMPGDMDGVALGRRIRQRWPGQAVVLITGFTSAPAATREFQVLDKPCTPRALVAALQAAVASPQPKVAPAGAGAGPGAARGLRA